MLFGERKKQTYRIKTDCHCHVLPKMDDGADSVETSMAMLEMMAAQGITRVCFTPHFHAHRMTVAEFLTRRAASYARLQHANPPQMTHLLGAEVAIERGISLVEGITDLRIGDTNYILLEPPFQNFGEWVIEEIYNLCHETGLVPIIAHVHRYADVCNHEQISQLLRVKGVFQINNEAFRFPKEKQFAMQVMESGRKYTFGSDAHNLRERKPNWDLLHKKVSSALLQEAIEV